MTQSDQIREDLSFVRAAVTRRDGEPPRFSTQYYIWAVYVLVGYCLLDINTHWANWFFLLAWFPTGAACGVARHFWGRKHGEIDAVIDRKMRRHFMYGGLLAVASVIGLACFVPGFRGPITGQVSVILFGIIYFLAGVHFDRSFLWLGPVLVVGGIVVGAIPHCGWSVLGIIIAVGLCSAAVINARRLREISRTERV
jgi:1,4-dihydroxy-2-naphthoate octaprenyltransferase